MATLRREVWIDGPPNDVWQVVRDPVAVTSWFPQVVAAGVDGDRRSLTLAGGMVLDERIAVRDDLRRFQYRLLGPLPVEEHVASIDVIADGDRRCLVVYGTDVVPHALAPVLDGAVGDALDRLKHLLEAR